MVDETLEFKLKSKFSDYELIANIINETWGSQCTANCDTLKSRFNKGELFVFAYDIPTQSDEEYILKKYSQKIGFEKIPVGILETIAIKTNGNKTLVPKTYEELTNNGFWNVAARDADTLILVDVTVLPSRRGKKGKREAKKTIQFVKQNLAYSYFKYVWTYTPNICAVKKWHQSMGAKDTQYLIKNARSKFIEPDVNLMDYSHFAGSKKTHI